MKRQKKLLFAFSFSARYWHKNKGCTDIVRHIPKKFYSFNVKPVAKTAV